MNSHAGSWSEVYLGICRDYAANTATVNLVSYWSKATFNELGVSVCNTESSHESHLYAVKNIQGVQG